VAARVRGGDGEHEADEVEEAVESSRRRRRCEAVGLGLSGFRRERRESGEARRREEAIGLGLETVGKASRGREGGLGFGGGRRDGIALSSCTNLTAQVLACLHCKHEQIEPSARIRNQKL
jgi:hypothetical protein